MARRITTSQSAHDDAVRAAASIYRQKGRAVSINPDGEQNESWSGRYIDVIAKRSQSATSAWVIEIETEDSISENEAEDQWTDYDEAYTQAWYLAVPVEEKDNAKGLLRQFGIQHCTIVTWQRNNDGTHTFWGLPGTKD